MLRMAAILYDKFHVMRHLSDALDAVRKSEYARLSGQDRKYIKGQKYTLLSRRENLSTHGRKALKQLLAANKRLKPYEKFAAMVERHWDGIAVYCNPENKVSLGFVEGLNNKIRVIQRRSYGLRDEEYLRLKILTCMLPPL
jgi:transposase